MAAALAQRVPADEHPRSGDQTAIDRLLHAPVSAARIPDGGKSLVQRLADHRRGRVGQQAGRIVPALLGKVHLNRADMDMGVDQPRHHRPAATLDHLTPGPGGRTRAGQHVLDDGAFDDHGGVVNRIRARAREDGGVTEADHRALLNSGRGRWRPGCRGGMVVFSLDAALVRGDRPGC
jgi:hypothetical protein